jgi:2-dehydro-3-deoxyglucarate aldolase/4-hydroxy-2-oxoheptanedioate aldolase
MPTNLTLSRLRSGQAVFGCILQQFRSAEIPRLLAAAGFDFVFIDCEHGGFDLETIQDVVRVARLSGITPLGRIGELSYSLVARALDVGPQGIILPRVDEPELLREALSWMKFPPAGKRGFGLGPPMLDYRTQSFADTIADANASILAVVQFERVKALERADKLLAVAGVDVGLIGPSDLSISMGVPGEFEHPSLVAAVNSFITVCNRVGVGRGFRCETRHWPKRGSSVACASSVAGAS